MTKITKTFWNAVPAGMAIALAGYASIVGSQGNPLLKALIFPVGLLLVCYCKFDLFTGNIYKVFIKEIDPTKEAIGTLVASYLGNLLGTAAIALLLPLDTTSIMIQKINTPLGDLMLLAVFCNMLVCLGVAYFPSSPLVTYICVFLFVICGMEHSIADMYYIFACGKWFAQSAIILFFITLGNIVGGMFIVLYEVFRGAK